MTAIQISEYIKDVEIRATKKHDEDMHDLMRIVTLRVELFSALTSHDHWQRAAEKLIEENHDLIIELEILKATTK